MPESKPKSSDSFILDSSDKDWRVRRCFWNCTRLARSIDTATGYFEFGSLLTLDRQWQKLEKIRIVMSGEISNRTRKALLAGVEEATRKLDETIEREKGKNDFLCEVPAIVVAASRMRSSARVLLGAVALCSTWKDYFSTRSGLG